ncbi:Uu.00g010370.m01.CDS01 [Anthostomella pinea]|uniref:Uu.00g010370.m01.CDS01 n=1 Tax=Anthostomella pinea TaxID=933095 RepID=A0AAI8YQ02_9PEZI|nr:Uu.00g010370.m01.CDS01 [Anthostomella pinea]
MASSSKTYLDLIKACDNFPCIDIGQTPWAEDPNPALYQLLLPDDPRPHGYILPSTVERMPWTTSFEVSAPASRPRTIKVKADTSKGVNSTGAAINAAFAELIQAATETQAFASLSRPREEAFRIMGAKFPSPPVQLRRQAAGLFGITCRGAHMTVYTRSKETSELKIWVPRRSAHLKTYPGKLDTSVAGGVRAEESPFECIVHEADEEASLPASLVRGHAKACGAVTYVSSSGAGSGGEMGLVVPDVLYVYDLEVGEDVVLKPQDDEVEEFYLLDVRQVKEALLREEFKTNCAPVMIDFFVRHGIITDDNEADYLEIVTRLHRPLPVPTSAGALDAC